MSETTTPTTRERLAAARAREAERQAKAVEEREAAELERLELVERFSADGGREDKDFFVVDLSDIGAGFVVVKYQDPTLWTTWKRSKMTDMDLDALVTPSVVYPDKETYRKLAVRLPAIVGNISGFVAKMYGLKLGEDQKK
jgi:hypothetical protein